MKKIKQRRRKIRKRRTRILMLKRMLKQKVSVALIPELKKLVLKMIKTWTRMRGIVLLIKIDFSFNLMGLFPFFFSFIFLR